MHPGILSAGIEKRSHWPCTSWSFWPFWLSILGNSGCPWNNSSKIWGGITKFAPNMQLEILLSGIENKGHWPWPSRSFWPFWLRILGNLACPQNNSSQIWVESPNLHQTWIIGYSCLVSIIGVSDLGRQGHFGHLTQNSRKLGDDLKWIWLS